jgi:trans-2,3-dihydro-3-hydroxyanthranilate isomerase
MADPIDVLARFDPFAGAGKPGARAYILLDVFTDTPLQGNPLAVFTDARGIDASRMQAIARELNISESVFALPAERGGQMRVRIFTPASELPFAGHPVLGAGIVCGRALGLQQLTLETAAGDVPLQLELSAGRAPRGTMSQPVPTWRDYERAGDLLAALGVDSSGLPVQAYVNGPTHLYVELASVDALSALRPDMRALTELGEIGVSCFARAPGHWRSRMFAPGLGVPEDPATGSAAGPLAVHLARHGRIAFGERIEIHQGLEIGRPSLLQASAEGSAESLERVQVTGAAVMIARAEMRPG